MTKKYEQSSAETVLEVTLVQAGAPAHQECEKTPCPNLPPAERNDRLPTDFNLKNGTSKVRVRGQRRIGYIVIYQLS